MVPFAHTHGGANWDRQNIMGGELGMVVVPRVRRPGRAGWACCRSTNERRLFGGVIIWLGAWSELTPLSGDHGSRLTPP